MNFEEDGTGFEHFQNIFIDKLIAFPQPENMDGDTCISFSMFYTIEALDAYVSRNLDSICMNFASFGPMNKGISRDNSLVYLQERWSFLSGAYSDDTEGFRKPLRYTRIGSVFHSILLMQRESFHAAIPEIVPIFLPDGYKLDFKHENNIRIASIPYIGYPTIRFHEANSEKACEIDQIPNGPFYVEYMDDDEGVCRVIALLELAIMSEANIVLFPEFIMSEAMLNAVKNYLQMLKNEKKKQLLLVLAGTNYQIYDRNKGNNVLHILNSAGYELGCYYKYSPFLQQSEEYFHGTDLSSKKGRSQTAVQDDIQKRKFLKNCEILSDPGKECTLIDVEVIGRILPAICRDVVDGIYTENLATLFMPSLLLVPAWSPSVASFDSRFSILADTLHTTSLLCNCCNAVKGQEGRVIGKLMYPSKQDSHMQSIPLEIMRSPDCARSCKDKGGCMRLIDIDFSNWQPSATQKTFFSNGIA